MSEFKNVTVVKKANVYFDGNVVSRKIIFADGTEKTLGFMQKGEYLFNTGAAELMEIFSGELEVQLPASNEWKRITGGESFNIPAESQFTMRVKTPSDYCCSFLK